MSFATLFAANQVRCCCRKATTKKQVLETLSLIAHESNPELKYQAVLEALQQRERLGSTAVGHGIAIPHARVEDLDQVMCVLLTLEHPIDFSAEESIGPVDIIACLLAPLKSSQMHLDTLATISDKLQDSHFRNQLRAAQNNQELLAVINQADPS